MRFIHLESTRLWCIYNIYTRCNESSMHVAYEGSPHILVKRWRAPTLIQYFTYQGQGTVRFCLMYIIIFWLCVSFLSYTVAIMQWCPSTDFCCCRCSSSSHLLWIHISQMESAVFLLWIDRPSHSTSYAGPAWDHLTFQGLKAVLSTSVTYMTRIKLNISQIRDWCRSRRGAAWWGKGKTWFYSWDTLSSEAWLALHGVLLAGSVMIKWKRMSENEQNKCFHKMQRTYSTWSFQSTWPKVITHEA